MNKDIVSAEEMVKLFDLFLDGVLADNIDFDDYLQAFREATGASENSPLEMTFRGFIGGLFIATVATNVVD